MSGAQMKVDGDVVGALSRLMTATGNMKPALRNVGEALRQSTIDRIKKGVSPDGTPFAPLSNEYAKRKKGPGILRGQSRQLASIVYQLGGDGQSVSVGNNVVYGAIHQFGGEIDIDMPDRIQTIYQRYDPKTGDLQGFVKRKRANFARDVEVKAHKVKVNMPARPYLGLSAEDRVRVIAIFEDFFNDATGGSGRR